MCEACEKTPGSECQEENELKKSTNPVWIVEIAAHVAPNASRKHNKTTCTPPSNPALCKQKLGGSHDRSTGASTNAFGQKDCREMGKGEGKTVCAIEEAAHAVGRFGTDRHATVCVRDCEEVWNCGDPTANAFGLSATFAVRRRVWRSWSMAGV